MKDLIPIILILIVFALLGINSSIKEGNLSPVEKTQLIEQKKEKQEAINKKIKEIEELQTKKYNEVTDTQKIAWIFLNVIKSPYFIMFIVFLLVFGFFRFYTRRMGV